jgi:hypothetical protein
MHGRRHARARALVRAHVRALWRAHVRSRSHSRATNRGQTPRATAEGKPLLESRAAIIARGRRVGGGGGGGGCGGGKERRDVGGRKGSGGGICAGECEAPLVKVKGGANLLSQAAASAGAGDGVESPLVGQHPIL